MISATYDSDLDSLCSTPPSSQSSLDEDDVNCRVKPHWPKYRSIIECRGYHLDTFHDVKEFYRHYSKDQPLSMLEKANTGYSRACRGHDDNALCPDAGLPESLFRGTRSCDGTKVVVKAVHLRSRELDIIHFLSSPPLRADPMNHCIPVLDCIDHLEDNISFIVMEEWSSQLVPDTPCTLNLFFGALRQCIEHAVFLHKYHIAHLDISLRNILTDYEGHYAYIDFELSRRFDGVSNPRIQGTRGTEIPPELDLGEYADPYKVDVWALGVLILRVCKLTGYCVPGLMDIVKPMLHDNPNRRPAASMVLNALDRLQSSYLEKSLHNDTHPQTI